MSSILIGTDFKSTSHKALKVGLSWSHKMDLSPIVVHVADGSFSTNVLRAAKIIDKEAMNYHYRDLQENFEQQMELIPELTQDIRQEISFKIAEGPADEAMAQVMKSENAQLLVLGTKERTAMNRHFLGTVTESIVRKTPGAILAIRDHFAASPSRISFICDFSSNSYEAWRWSLKIHQYFNSEIEIIHVVTPHSDLLSDRDRGDAGKTDEGKKLLIEKAKALAQKEFEAMVFSSQGNNLGSKLKTSLLTTTQSIGDAIASHLEKNRPHLLIMGSHGRSGLKKLLMGSNAEDMLAKTDCNILIVRPN